MEKVMDNKGNPVIYVHSDKDFKNTGKKKIHGKK